MRRYIKSFEDSEAIQNAIDNGDLSKPYVAYNEDADVIDWNTKTETDYRTIPLTFEILSDGNIVWKNSTLSDGRMTIQYSKNGGEWTEITSSNEGTSINVNSGDIVQFRGNNRYYSYKEDDVDFYNTFSGSTAQFKVYGNIMSLINSTNFSGLTTFPTYSSSVRVFYFLFRNCTGLTDASKLILPATTLAQNCYGYMFQDCTSLTTAPELPATTLAQYCYYRMFRGCTSLTTAPELPATTLAQYCYYEMFRDCSLNYIKCIATDISASNCTTSWVYGVQTTSGTFVKASGTSWPSGTSGIPYNWTVVDAEL